MADAPRFETQPLHGVFFEDIIDGYFPLYISLTDLMQRRNFTSAFICLSHAPIMEVPGLPSDAPVPVSIKDGRAGVITQLALHIEIAATGLKVQGQGTWHWLRHEPIQDADRLHIMTRLAEPAFLRGFGMRPEIPTRKGLPTTPPKSVIIPKEQTARARDVLGHIGLEGGSIIGPFLPKADLQRGKAMPLAFDDFCGSDDQRDLPPGTYTMVPPALSRKIAELWTS